MGRKWDESEDKILRDLVAQLGKQWGLIAAKLPSRSPSQVSARWEKCLDPSLTKGPFTQEEDEKIKEYVKSHGPQNWPRITGFIPGRSAKQCRERWFNHLDPSVVKKPWTQEEDNTIFENYMNIGGKWSIIAKLIPGRTDNAIKNRWNSSISRRIKKEPSGSQYLLPDTSKRQNRTSGPVKERPPPIITPVHQQIQPLLNNEPANPVNGFKMSAPPSLDIQSPVPLTPLTIPTPVFAQGENVGFFSPTSPSSNFASMHGGFGSPLGSAVGGSMFSPTQSGFESVPFK